MELTDKNFDKEVLKEEGPVFVDFWGSWCLACQQMEPVIKNLEKEIGNKIKIGTLNIDKNPETSTKYEIEETPTHILFKDGEIIERQVGAKAGIELKQMIQKNTELEIPTQ